jgi:hypothetical protein
MWATWRGPADPAGLSKVCGQVPQQLSTDWHLPAPSPAGPVGASPWPASCAWLSRCGHLRQEVDQSDGLVARWTWPSSADTTTKPLALVASLFAQEARLALRALVDDAGAWDAAWHSRQGGRRVPIAPSCLATRVIAKATPTVRRKAVTTPRARASDRSAAIVTQRRVRHARSPCAGAVPACV